MRFKFDLDEVAVNIIGKALGAQPHDVVRATLDEMQKQINAQQKPAVVADFADEKKEAA